MPLWLVCSLAALALLVLLVSAIIIVKCFCPALFLKLRFPYGIILHAITGGKIPPYFTHWPYEEQYQQEVFRDGDVIVATGAKSGTTWMMNIVHQLRCAGDPANDLKHNTHTTPWPECWWHPGETAEDAFATLQTLDGWTNPKYPFRAYKSHYRPRVDGVPWSEAVKTDSVVPVRQRRGLRFVVCMREGRDVLASMYPFMAAHRQEFRDMWGGLPQPFKDFDECFDMFVRNSKSSFWHEHVAAWWDYRHDPNVLLLHFNDLKRDIRGCLAKIASFLELSIPVSAWPLIEEKVSLKWMKEHEDIFKYHMTGPTFTGNIMTSEAGSFIRKGVSGEGKGLLSPEQQEIWDGLSEDYFGSMPGLKEWILTGGPLPGADLERGAVDSRSPRLTTPLMKK